VATRGEVISALRWREEMRVSLVVPWERQAMVVR
jgi:hypothetical protein